MKSFKMKSLAVAVLGLAGFAGNAMACPAGASIANGGAWTSSATSQGVQAVVAGGLGVPATACKLQVALNQNSQAFAKSIVTDTSPVDEPRYRARFYIDVSEIPTLNTGLRAVKIFNASSSSSPAGLSGEEVRIQLTGSTGAPTAVFTIADSTQPNGFNQFSVALPNPTGSNRIEFDLIQGASTTFSYWVENGTTASAGALSPTGTVTGVNNSGWSGVTQGQLGEFGANTGWRSTYTATTHLNFDEFDSRRQTFIGQ